MKNTLNFLTAFFGILLLFNGIFKSFDMLSNINLYVGNMYLTIPNSNAFIYILLVNFIGGFSMIFHSISTVNFKKKLIFKEKYSNIIDVNTEIKLKTMSNLSLITGIITMIISFWLLIRATVILSSFNGSVMTALPLFIFALFLFITNSLVPILLVGKNIALNNEILAILKRNALQEILENRTYD